MRGTLAGTWKAGQGLGHDKEFSGGPGRGQKVLSKDDLLEFFFFYLIIFSNDS